jgi:YrbI family 3-deoxy-D-manno-octulosonate 8-phosphate phosphatase
MVDDIRIVLSDVDGVWTDRKIYIGEDGCQLRAYSTEDSIGVVLLKIMQLPLVILTGEDNNSLKNRMERLKVARHLYRVRNKLYIADQALKKYDLTLFRPLLWVTI